MSQQHPHPHHHQLNYHHYQQQQQQQQLHHQHHLQQHQQQQQQSWYSHVASYPTHHATAFAGAPCKANNMNAYGAASATHGYYAGGGGSSGNAMGLNVNAGASGMPSSYNMETPGAANTVAYAHNQLLQYQQQQQQHQQQPVQQQAQQQQQHSQRSIYFHGPSYPYIKSEPMELPDERQQRQQQQPQQQHFHPPNPMAPPPVPNAPSGSEMIIKSEPIDEHAYKANYIDDNTPFADFSKYSEYSQDMLSPKVELTIKDEAYANASQKHALNFPRRKMQTERSDSLPICQRCKEVFFKKQTYLRHVAESSCSIHEYDFKCSICPMSFMSIEELEKHKQFHRLDKFFCHKYCGKHYDTIAECESHEYMQHEYDSFVCNICSGNFVTREQLYAHLPQHKFQTRYDCPICRLWYQTPLELHEHRMAAPYFCGKYYATMNNVQTNANSAQQQHQQHQQQQQQQANYKLQDCHMGAIEMPTTHHKSATIATTTGGASNDLPATAALNSLMQQRQANADGLYSSMKSDVKLERSYSTSTSESNYSLHDSGYNNTYGSDVSLHTAVAGHGTGAAPTQSANSSTLDDSEDALCCVPLCGVRKSTSPTLQFFTFPKDEKYLHQWLHNLKMFHIPAATYLTYRICSMHFPKRCINRYSLCYWAVPTFNLGHDDVANLYQNRELTNTFTTGEVARCSMPNCNSQRGESNLKFYNFPKDIKSLIKWCQNARLPVQAKEPRHFCSRHFEERCIGKFRLKPWAVPTLHLGTQYGKIHDNPKNLYVEEKRCCLPFCRRSRSSDFNMSLYRFPRDEVLLRRWCYNLRLDPGVYRGKNHKICSAHFIKEALGLRKLSPGAVPTLHLGHNDTFNIYENELWPPPSPAASSNHQHHHQSKSYQRHSAASTSSSASSTSMYVDSEMNAPYISMTAGASGNALSSSSLNVTECMDVCCVPGCESKRHNNENITFHTIPRRPEQMRKWCHNIKIPEEKMHKGMRICSLHFENYCIGGCMRPFAVPTLNLGHDDEDIHRNPDVIKKLNIRETCCVQVCKRNRDRDHANLHRFPSNVALLTKWCANLHRPVPDGIKLFNDAICEVHFEDRCLRNKRLEKWAVPTLQLGHEDIPCQLPTESEVAEFYARPSAPNAGDEEGECCVETCKRNPNVDDIKLYRPPEEAGTLAKWAHNLQVDAEQLPNMRICNLHFESHCIGKRMRPWAIPTLNLATNIENLYENPEHTMIYKRRQRRRLLSNSDTPSGGGNKPTWVPRCCLPHCRKVRAIHNVQLFRFPKINRSTLAKWAHNLQVPLMGSAQRRLCSAHFEPHVLSKKCPVPLAVPTLDLNTPPGYKIYQNPAKLKASKLCLQRVCIVESCRRQRSHGVQLFRFPHSHTQQRKWLHNIKQTLKGSMRSQFRICSMHFETHSFNGKRLSAGAIPTLELGHDDDDIYPNEVQSFIEEHCTVEGCSSSKEQPEVRLFRFPTEDEDLLWKWCNNLKMNPVDCIGVRICNKHFEPDCIGPKHLFKFAIPTLELGHDDAEIELIPNPKPEDRYVDPVFKCCVPTCGKTRKFDEVQMNSFPKDPIMFERWRHNLHLEHLNFRERERYKICNAHFEDICIGKTRLNIGAIPTLELGHDDTDDLYQVNPAELQSNLFGRQRRITDTLPNIKQEPLDYETNLDSTMEEASDSNTKQVKIKKSLSELKCCVKTCGRSRLEHGVRLYPLPTSKQIHNKWRRNLNLETHEVERTTRVCNAHFNKRCFDGKQLRNWAIPTLHLGYQHQPIYENPKNIPGFFTPTCALSHCRRRRSIDNDLRTYRYPKSDELLEKWCANLRLEPSQCRGRICAYHFEPQVRGKLKLKTGAVPTLNLGHEEGLIFDNEAIKGTSDYVEEAEEVTDDVGLDCVKPKREPMDEEEEPEHNEEHDDNENDDQHGFYDPLELVETFAEQHTDNEEVDDSEPEHLLPDSPPPPPRERPTSNGNMPICCLKHCRKEKTPTHHLSTFGFPKDRQLLLKWCANLQLRPIECVGRVCIEHFDPEVLGSRKLKQNAVPTLNVGHDEPLPYAHNGVELATATISNYDEQPQHSVFRLCSLKHCRKRKMTEPPDIAIHSRERVADVPDYWMTSNRCCVARCGKTPTANGVRLLRLPKERVIQRKWLHNLKLISTASSNSSSLKVCTEHFETQYLKNGILQDNIVPTLRLGHKDSSIYRNKVSQPANKHVSANTTGACLVPHCLCERLNLCRYYALPTHQKVQAAWLLHLNLPDLANGENANDDTLQMQLCAMHYMELHEQVELPSSVPANVRIELHHDYNRIACTALAQKLRCSVPGCFSKYTDNLRLSRMPQCEQMCVKWLHNTKIKYDPARHYIYRICMLHFEQHCWGAIRLKAWAVPTLQLNNDDAIYLNVPDSMHDPPTMPLRIKTELDGLLSMPKASPSPGSGAPKICCIASCGQLSGCRAKLFRFPCSELLLQKWIINTQQPMVEASRLYICEAHFEPGAICKKSLRAWAVPTLQLGHEDYVIPNAKHNGDIADSQQDEELLQYIRQNYCAVMTCFQKSSESVRLYTYPQDRRTVRKWATNCKHRSMQASSHGFQICQAHFANDCFVNSLSAELREGAVPTLQLGADRQTPLQSAWFDSKPEEQQCAVAQCNSLFSPDNDSLGFYKFPKHTETLNQWCHNLSLSAPPENVRQLQVCELHFEQRCKKDKQKLVRGALPTLLLDDIDEANIIRNSESIFLLNEDQQPVCCVNDCGKSKLTDKVQLSAFPRLRTLAEKWLHNLRLNFNPQQLTREKVCSIHFEPNCYDHGRIRLGAMPTLHLGHKETDIFHTNLQALGKSRRHHTHGGINNLRIELHHKCCQPNCREFEKPYKRACFDLPSSAALRDSWCKNLNIADDSDLQLCPLHFVLLYEHSESSFTEHSQCTDNELSALQDSYNTAKSSVRLRGLSCCVPQCKSLQPRDGCRLFMLPHDGDLLAKWLHNMQLNFTNDQRYLNKICDKHFEPRCGLNSRRLKAWAVPTLHLPAQVEGTGKSELYENPKDVDLELLSQNSISRDQYFSEESNISHNNSLRENTRSGTEDNSVLEPIVKLEPVDADDAKSNAQESVPDVKPNIQSPIQMEELEVLLEVGHVEKCTTYELIDTGPPINELSMSNNKSGHHYKGSQYNTYNARRCCVDGCDITINDTEVKLHKFPQSLDVLQKWMHNTQVDVDTNYSWRYRICSYHFEPECFNGYRFRTGTMPTLHLGPRRPLDIYENEFNDAALEPLRKFPKDKVVAVALPNDSNWEESDEEIIPSRNVLRTKKSGKYCQIEGCFNHLTSANVTLHKFPQSPELCDKWQHNTQVPFNADFRWRYRICSAHFHPFCLMNTRLLHGSVPTLKLGPNAPTEIYDNSFQTLNMRFDKETCTEPTEWTTANKKQPEEEDFEEEIEDDDNDNENVELLVPELCIVEGRPSDSVGQRTKIERIHKWTHNSPQPLLKETKIKQENFVYNQIKSGYDKCSLIHCQKQRSQHGVHIYKFPKSKQQQLRWMHNLRIQFDESRPWKYLICSEHFERQCIRLRKLKSWAVPTLKRGGNVPHDSEMYTNEQPHSDSDDSDHEVDKEEQLEDSTEKPDPPTPAQPSLSADGSDFKFPAYKIKFCCLPHCRNPRGDGIKLFRLPTNASVLRKWEQATGMAFKSSQRNTKLICSKHFSSELIGIRRLSQGAIPTLHLLPASKTTANKKDTTPLIDKPATTVPIRAVANSCCISNCKHAPNANLYRFPTDPKLLRNWCQSLKLNDIQRYRGKHVCAAHLPNKQSVKEKTCLVCGVDGEWPFFRFPDNRNARAKWCYNLKIEPINKWNNVDNLCSKHFENHCFDKSGKLLPDAVPTIQLKHTDVNIFHNQQLGVLRSIKDESLVDDDNDDVLL